MKRFFYLLILLTFATVLAPPVYAVKIGETCPVVGQTYSDLVCLINSKKKIWQKLETSEAVQKVIELSLKSTELPKNLKLALKSVRSDKSVWLDQECSVDFPDVRVPDCFAGDPAGKKSMVIYGDSHASMWMTALDQIAKKRGYKIYLFAKLACPLVESTIWSYQLNRPFKECAEWQQLVLSKIQLLKPEVLVVTNQWKPAVVDDVKSDIDTPMMWEQEFPKALQKLNSWTRKLVVIGNNPSMQQDSVTCASKPRVNLSLCSAGRAQAGNIRINLIEENAAKSAGAIYINTVDMACTSYLCPIVIGGKFVYFDQWHFTQTYVNWLTPVLQRSMRL